MKKGEKYSGIISRVDFPNRSTVCVKPGADEDFLPFQAEVKGGIPGQKVLFRVKKKGKNKCKGIFLGVEEKSPIETCDNLCERFGECGGCTYLSVPYEEQLKIKKDQIRRLFKDVIVQSDFDNIYEGIVENPNVYGYRNKMEFSFGDEVKGGPLTLGLHKKHSFHDIIDINGCKIVHEDYLKIIECVKKFALKYDIKFYNKMTHEGALRYLLVRRSETTNELLIALVTSSQYSNYVENFKELCDEILVCEKEKLEGKIAGFIHIVSDTLADKVACDSMDILYGHDYFYENILGLTFKVSLFSFFQTNTRGAEKLYEKVREYVLSNSESSDGDGKKEFVGKVVFDLYSGTGTIGQMLAPVCDKVIGVEIVEDAVLAARENAKINNLDNCEFIAADVLKDLDEIEERPDFIVLDPPREGINPKALRKILAYGVQNIVYISCKPTSLVNDLEMMQEAGYRVKRMCNVDMFSSTVHIETIVQLVNIGVKPDYTVRLELDVEEFYNAVGQDKRDYIHSEEYARIKAKYVDK